jgi:hypothetical protein
MDVVLLCIYLVCNPFILLQRRTFVSSGTLHLILISHAKRDFMRSEKSSKSFGSRLNLMFWHENTKPSNECVKEKKRSDLE